MYMGEILLCLAAIMVLVVMSAAQSGLSPIPPGIEEEILMSCPSEIRACAPFADSTTTRPTAICCEPLESVIANNISCLCLLFGNEDVIEALEIDVPKAITLPQRCGLRPFDLSSDCQDPMAPSTTPTMSSANAPTSGRDDSGTISIARTGSGIMGLFLLCATLMLY